MKRFNLEEYLKNPSRKVVTRDGKDVRIICTDRKDATKYCVVGLITDPKTQNESIYSWTKEGTWNNEVKKGADLFFAPTKSEGWVNIFTYTTSTMKTDGNVFSSYEEARDSAENNPYAEYYVATVKIEWEE